MAAVSVTANNTRVDDAEAVAGWSSIGGGQGPSAEGSFPYQGGNLVNKRITSTGGVRYDPIADGGAAQDVTAASTAHWMVKGIVTDYGGLNAASGVRVEIGSSSTVFHKFVIAGTNAVKNALDLYPARGGLLIVPVNANIAGYRDSTSGSPVLTAVDHFGFEANFDSSSAKAENVGCDAIDLGTGLTLTGGDGADPDAVWQDFTDADEGTTGNRWGFASSTFAEVLLFYGQLTIGTATATVFNDSGAQILWPDGLYASGFSRVFADLQNAATTIHDGSVHTGLGSTNVEDTRPDYVWSGTAGTGTASHTLKNFRNYVLTSAVTLNAADIQIADLTQGGATLNDTTIRCTSAVNVAVCNDFTVGDTTNLTVVQSGAGHFVDYGAVNTQTINWTVTTSGFPVGTVGLNTDTANGNEAILVSVNSGQTLTINVAAGASIPSVKNDGPGDVEIVAGQVTLTVTAQDIDTGAAIQGARVLVEAAAGGALSVGTVIIDKVLTDVNGQASDTRSYSGNQPITGRVRKASAAPLYQTAPVTGTINASSGLSLTIPMIPDE